MPLQICRYFIASHAVRSPCDTSFLYPATQCLSKDKIIAIWDSEEREHENEFAGKNCRAFLSLLIGMLFVASTPCMAESSGIVAFNAGDSYAIAVYDNGTVFGWGDNLDGWGDSLVGVLGVTDGRYVYTPVQLPIDNVKAVSAGLGDVLALKKDGTVWAWERIRMVTLGTALPTRALCLYR